MSPSPSPTLLAAVHERVGVVEFQHVSVVASFQFVVEATARQNSRRR
jgi:hypothetical protein